MQPVLAQLAEHHPVRGDELRARRQLGEVGRLRRERRSHEQHNVADDLRRYSPQLRDNGDEQEKYGKRTEHPTLGELRVASVKAPKRSRTMKVPSVGGHSCGEGYPL